MQLINYIDKFYYCKDVNEQISAVYFGMQKKTFDSVSQNVLLNIFTVFGFDDPFSRLISSYLSNRFQRVRVNNSLSFEDRVSSGIPQRSILGFLQFLFYINDLPDVVNHYIP